MNKSIKRIIQKVLGLEEITTSQHLTKTSIQDIQRSLTGLHAALQSLSNQVSTIRDAQSSPFDTNALTQMNTEARDAIIHQVNYVNQNLYLHLKEASRVRELYYRDMMLAIDRVANIYPATTMHFEAELPVAIDTDDHLKPWGAAHDNTRLPRFVLGCERYFAGRELTAMDLGCSGGGIVLDFNLRGHRAFGIEGSDHPKNSLRGEWRVLKDNLFTADITRPFTLSDPGATYPVQCDVISMWEVMEHISEEDLPQLFENIKRHLKPDGIFVGSIALVPDDHGGASYHRTVQPRAWWEAKYRELGFSMLQDHGFYFSDFARGTSNGPIDENYEEKPHVGFHFIAARTSKAPTC